MSLKKLWNRLFPQPCYKWNCTHCGADPTVRGGKCGDPGWRVPVHYEGGRVCYERPACPLALVEDQ
jgi:hypothetical protein